MIRNVLRKVEQSARLYARENSTRGPAVVRRGLRMGGVFGCFMMGNEVVPVAKKW